MNTAEIKNDLHKFIVETEDINVLKQVKSVFLELIKSSPNSDLSPQEERMITMGIEQADNNLLTPNDQVRSKVKTWISEKNK